MVQHVIQLRAQASRSIGQRNGLRFIAEVAAGQHDGRLAPPHQQVVQGGGRQHGAQQWQPRRDALGQRGCAAWQQHDGRCGTAERSGGGLVHFAPDAQLVQVACQQGERFGFAPLQRPQPGHRRRVAGVTGQLVTAQAFDEQDLALANERGRGVDIVQRRQRVQAESAAVQAAQRGLGAAGVAGHGLGVEAAVVGIGIFALAVSAQRERRHRRVGPVVGRAPEHRQARAAVGAGGEGVAVAAREGV